MVYEKLKLSIRYFSSSGSNSYKKSTVEISSADSIFKVFNIIYIVFCIFSTLIFIFYLMFNSQSSLFNYFSKLPSSSGISEVSKGFTSSISSGLISVLIIDVLVYIVSRLILSFINRKNSQKRSIEKNIDIYNRQLPSKLTPAHVRLLINDGLIDSESLAATILDLVDRGYLKLSATRVDDLFNKEIFISVTDKNQDDLFDYEKYLINWLFDKNNISSLEIKNKLHNAQSNPSEDFNIFQGLVLLSFPINSYYTKNKNNSLSFCIWGILCLINIVLFFIPTLNTYAVILYGIFMSIFSIGLVLLLANSVSYRLNDTGKDLIIDYLRLKKYLEEFTLIQDKSSEQIVLWNYYLSYSIALGIESIAFKEINEFFGNEIYYFNYSSAPNENTNNYINKMNEFISNANKLYLERK